MENSFRETPGGIALAFELEYGTAEIIDAPDVTCSHSPAENGRPKEIAGFVSYQAAVWVGSISSSQESVQNVFCPDIVAAAPSRIRWGT